MGAGSIVGTVETRKYPYAAVDWPAILACGDASISCVIANLSANGATVAVAEPPAGPIRVMLYAAGFGKLEGDIIWRSPKALGIRFVLAPDRVAALLGDKLPV